MQHKSLHFIGIGGVGMSALADYCHERGLKVTGSDIGENKYTKALSRQGIEIVPHHESSLCRSADAVIYSTAIQANNLELQLARDLKKTIYHRASFLAELSQEKQCIAVAGSHGKTTTSAMIAHIFVTCGLDPDVIIGGQMRSLGKNHRCGNGPFSIIEADESDGSFMKYAPFISVVTNIGADHLDYHGDLDGLKDSFVKFLSQTDAEGGAVLGWDNAYCREIAEKHSGNILSFGSKIGCDFRVLSLKVEAGASAVDFIAIRDRLQMVLPAPGQHNVQNALAAIAVAHLSGISVTEATQALESFKGVDRRLNRILSTPSLAVYDDYAHNPDKIAACLDALRLNYPKRKLHVAFQPHRYSRLMTTWKETASAFRGADIVYLADVYAAGETAPDDFSIKTLATDIERESKTQVVLLESFDNIIKMYDNNKSASDVILTTGAGDIFKAADLVGVHFGKENEEKS